MDMPMNQLQEYKGTNPCPADFDEYWRKALEELDHTDLNPILIPGPMQTPFAECFDLWFTGIGEAKIHAHYVRPKKREKPCPAILCFHGYSGNCGDWWETFGYTAGGFCAAFMDCRGQGGLSQDIGGVMGNTYQGHIIRGLADGPEKLLFRANFLDTVALARIIMSFEEVDETKVAAVGGSQGGGLSIACAALEPRINRIAIRYPFLSDYQRVWEMGLARDAYGEITQYFRLYDPAHRQEEKFFTTLGYIDVHHLAKRIHCPVRLATGMVDTVCPPSTQFAIYNNLSSKDKAHTLYPDFGHECAPGWNDEVYAWLLEMSDSGRN